MLRWLAAFAITQIVETPIYARAQPGVSWQRRLAIGAGASAVTHPVVWFVIPRIVTHGWITHLLVAEAFAIGVEGLWLRAFGVQRALLLSVFANACSVGVGLAIRSAFGFP